MHCFQEIENMFFFFLPAVERICEEKGPELRGIVSAMAIVEGCTSRVSDSEGDNEWVGWRLDWAKVVETNDSTTELVRIVVATFVEEVTSGVTENKS